MILGQHSALDRDENGRVMLKSADKKSVRYPIVYAQTVVEAINSGKFAYIAHPDIYLQFRDDITDNEKSEYAKNAEMAAKMICEAAAKNKIPLEINLGNINAVSAGIKKTQKDGSYAYPVPAFWKYAQKYGCDVLIGQDAHNPDTLKDKRGEMIAKKLMEDHGIELNYLKEFHPLGIGKETSRAPSGVSQSTPEEKKDAFLRRCQIDTELCTEASEVVKEQIKNLEKENPETHNIDE